MGSACTDRNPDLTAWGPEVTVRGRQHETGGGDVEDVDTPVGQQGEQLHHVEVRHEAVGQLHERPGEQHLSRQCRPLSLCRRRPTLGPIVELLLGYLSGRFPGCSSLGGDRSSGVV